MPELHKTNNELSVSESPLSHLGMERKELVHAQCNKYK